MVMKRNDLKNESLYRDRYRILRKLGEGGSSMVYMGCDMESGKAVTVKVFKEGVLNGADIKNAVMEETALLQRLDHPDIPKVLAVYEDAFVLEHVHGNSLDKVLKAKGALPEKTAVQMGKELLKILTYLHGRKNPVIYRDLKPANIIVKPDGHVALIDFGAAREYCPGVGADTLNLGTCGYAAPEQYGSLGQTDVRTDIYCFGRTLMQMMAGGEKAGSKNEGNAIKAGRPKTVSPELRKILEKCTRPDRDDRFGSCREIGKALEGYPRAVAVRRLIQGVKAALIAAVLALGVTAAVSHYDTVRSYAAEDAKQRIPAVKERLGNAGLRIRAMLDEEEK
ncbi:MAG: serine/threonine protein kinase [Butyrivibrio sp.]|nr:serine/threonine protein kinase [Butyrivibrio sp.]